MKLMINICVLTRCMILTVFFCLLLGSCSLFDKDIKQDQHISKFRYQLNNVQDSLDIPAERIKAFKTLIEYIKDDKDIITLRKRNMLLIDAYNYLSNEYVQIRNYTKALEFSNISIGLDTTNAKGYFNRGCIYQAMDNDSIALQDYTLALNRSDNYADALYNRGIIYEKTKKYKEALTDYNKAVKQQPSYLADVYNNRGNVYLALEDSVKALSDYTKVLELDTTNIYTYSNRAGLYIKLKEFEKALVDCNKGLSIDPTFLKLYNQRAYIYGHNKEYDKAINDYRKVLELDHNNIYDAEESIRKLHLEIKRK